jgi:hypothetical protein
MSAAIFLRDKRFIANAINATAPTLAEWQTLVNQATTDHERAACALVAGKQKISGSETALLPWLDKDAPLGKTAAWALGQLASTDGHLEKNICGLIATGSFDVRENGYFALAVIAARQVASSSLITEMSQRVGAEIERARSGGSGLGEHACRILAILGADKTVELIQQVIDQDRFCDRFELQRQRKAISDNGRDSEAKKQFSGTWEQLFADAIAPEPQAELAPKAAPKATPKAEPAAKTTAGKMSAPIKPPTQQPQAQQPPMRQAPPSSAPTDPHAYVDDYRAGQGGDDYQDGADNEANAADHGETAAAGDEEIKPIDWKAFATSPEAATLPEQIKPLATQLGPLLEQLALRAIRVPLGELGMQEFVALLLQVMPQALPPQHVQMALSPQAMMCYKAVVNYLIRIGAASDGAGLLQAIAMVRKELTNQIRQAGILNGPDYSDPDEKVNKPLVS